MRCVPNDTEGIQTMQIKLANYMADFFSAHNIQDVFTITGGGAMHLNDAFGHHEGLHCTYNHHEQACAMAAEDELAAWMAISRCTGSSMSVPSARRTHEKLARLSGSASLGTVDGVPPRIDPIGRSG